MVTSVVTQGGHAGGYPGWSSRYGYSAASHYWVNFTLHGALLFSDVRVVDVAIRQHMS